MASYINETQAHFQEQCVAAGVIASADSSLENCLVELRRVLDAQDIKLKAIDTLLSNYSFIITS